MLCFYLVLLGYTDFFLDCTGFYKVLPGLRRFPGYFFYDFSTEFSGLLIVFGEPTGLSGAQKKK